MTIEQDIAQIVNLNTRKHEPIPAFLTNGVNMNNQSESGRVLEGAARLAENENYALYGDQVKFNLAVSELVGLMMKHRSQAIGDATFSELVRFSYNFMRVLKGTVHNSQSYLEAASSLGIAAECAAKEDKQ